MKFSFDYAYEFMNIHVFLFHNLLNFPRVQPINWKLTRMKKFIITFVCVYRIITETHKKRRKYNNFLLTFLINVSVCIDSCTACYVVHETKSHARFHDYYCNSILTLSSHRCWTCQEFSFCDKFRYSSCKKLFPFTSFEQKLKKTCDFNFKRQIHIDMIYQRLMQIFRWPFYLRSASNFLNARQVVACCNVSHVTLYYTILDH